MLEIDNGVDKGLIVSKVKVVQEFSKILPDNLLACHRNEKWISRSILPLRPYLFLRPLIEFHRKS